MKEGWYNDDYWMMCEDQQESEHLTTLYGIRKYIPDYFIVGLKGWDYFILCDRNSHYFTVPTLPVNHKEIKAFHLPEPMRLESDDKLTKKIKWYVKPIAFGGDPSSDENIAWLTTEEHSDCVKWWNQIYQDTTNSK